MYMNPQLKYDGTTHLCSMASWNKNILKWRVDGSNSKKRKQTTSGICENVCHDAGADKKKLPKKASGESHRTPEGTSEALCKLAR